MAVDPQELDVRGLLCPWPVLKAQKRLAAMQPGERLRVAATDPAAAIDMPHYCAQSGNRLLREEREGGVWYFLIEKSEPQEAVA